ncbi:hypothetical protein B6N60_00337 [Richelia sinica FACHB-800]|uniref:type II site-specific deoxyribonuclease n=1 Tax=Richelia sinica FACHB-800 TaxID=1357546 RepID=A0A975Y318_9NOST|nr:hypothetical protein B6N60_00337 [Richelia sinica FACHB-800]
MVLYILAKDGTELFFEIKAPKPNKGQCLEVTQRLLRFHLLRGQNRPQVKAYYAMPYNPYGATKFDYKWSYTINYTPFNDAVVIGHDFWEIIGGKTAYTYILHLTGYPEKKQTNATTKGRIRQRNKMK